VDPIVVTAIVISVASLTFAALAFYQVSKARKEMRIFRGDADEMDILEASAEHGRRNDQLEDRIQRLAKVVAICQRDTAESLRHLAVVRFNAVADMGGQFSFSAAMLDDSGSGVVFTSIQGHNQGRFYAKSIIDGKSEYPLTPEEAQAIDSARPEDRRR